MRQSVAGTRVPSDPSSGCPFCRCQAGAPKSYSRSPKGSGWNLGCRQGVVKTKSLEKMGDSVPHADGTKGMGVHADAQNPRGVTRLPSRARSGAFQLTFHSPGTA